MRETIIKILLIEDEEFDVRRVKRTLSPFKDRINIQDVVSDGKTAIELLEGAPKNYDVIIMDFQIAGGLKGESLIRRIKGIDSTLQIIVITKMTVNVTDFDFANSLLEAGAMWYCTKYPVDIEEFIYQPTDFILSIFNAFEKKQLEKEKLRSNRRLNRTIQDILNNKKIIGKSKAIRGLRKIIGQLSEIDMNVLLRGESGTGKELIAANIHYTGRRRLETFLPVNCGSLPESLIESELFGFEKGSFTGAASKKKGLFEIADKGSIFLDEITELPLKTQSTLLRVIQDGEIDKIGRTGKIQVDVRIIAATNKDIESEVREKRFREDLYYRLNVVSIIAPPLRERQEDISLLMDHFMVIFSKNMNRSIPKIDCKALDLLAKYRWPGNVRELENVIQRLLITGERNITEKQIRLALGIKPLDNEIKAFQDINSWDTDHMLSWQEMEKRFRKEYFQFVRFHSQTDAAAAKKLGLAPSNFYRMCKDLGLK